MNRNTHGQAKRFGSFFLLLCLTAGQVFMADWFAPSICLGYRGGAVRGPGGGAAVRAPSGAAAARGPYGGTAARGPNGAVVAAPRGRVAPPPPPHYPAGARPPVGAPLPPARYPGAVRAPVPMPVPVPVAPAYYRPPASGVAAGMAMGAMLTVLPATAMAVSASSGHTVYVVDSKCYKEVKQSGAKYYEQINCP